MENKRLYLSEFQHHDGTNLVTFNIVDINTDEKEITVAISSEGKITRHTFDLKWNNDGYFFEYGIMLDEIAVDDFEQVDDEQN